MVNFEALAVENEAECQVALEALERITEMLRHLDRVGEKIGEDKVIEYKKYLLQYREKIIKRTKKARAAFELNRDLKTKRFNADVRYNRTKEEKELAEIYNQLRDISNDLSRDVIGVLGVEIELMKIMLDKKIYGDGLLHIEEMLREKPELNRIGKSVFAKCSNLKEVEMNRELKTIGKFAFYESGLNEILIPESVETIGEKAFYGCNDLERIYCRMQSKPDGWHADWNLGCSAEVVWGYNSNVRTN